MSKKVLIILDDREYTSGDISRIVGRRLFGDIFATRKSQSGRIKESLPIWAEDLYFHIRNNEDITRLRSAIENSPENTALFIVSASAGISDIGNLTQIIERLPYAEEDFTSSLYRPLLIFFHNAHFLIEKWKSFEISPLHLWDESWNSSQRLKSILPLDLSKIRDFLVHTERSTATRHFNQVDIDAYYYTKRSTDKEKILAEYLFFELVPEEMRAWLIQPFFYRDEGDTASYKMLRYYLADTAIQWVHGGFDKSTFTPLIDRLLFFLNARPRKTCDELSSAISAKILFNDKVNDRIKNFLSMDEGVRINAILESSMPSLGISAILDRYLKIYQKYENKFLCNYSVIGHGDPCFSNILYDQERFILKLIDPKGALTTNDLWCHPMYDFCKISHSVLGDYDFINSGQYVVTLTDKNELRLRIDDNYQAPLKAIFLQRIKAEGIDIRALRIGEASLFLSMIPLHIDYPNKIIAFVLKAKEILDEVECG